MRRNQAPNGSRVSSLRLVLALGCALAVAAVASGAVAGRSPSVVTHPVIHLLHGSRPGAAQQSTNWAGYVASKGGYNHVSVSWRVPTVTTTADNRYSATWAGIGGDPTPDLIQAGTEQDSVGGVPRYYAWTEILPEPERKVVGFGVGPGNSITVDIRQRSLDRWTITLRNNSTGQSFSLKTAYPSAHLTADWIHEAPTVGGTVARLARTTTVIFDQGYANGKTIANAGSVGTIDMYQGTSRIATTGPLDSDGDGFAVADGSAAPGPPAS